MGMATRLNMWPGPFEQTFIPPSHGGPLEIRPSGFKKKKFENAESEWPWTKVN